MPEKHEPIPDRAQLDRATQCTIKYHRACTRSFMPLLATRSFQAARVALLCRTRCYAIRTSNAIHPSTRRRSVYTGPSPWTSRNSVGLLARKATGGNIAFRRAFLPTDVSLFHRELCSDLLPYSVRF